MNDYRELLERYAQVDENVPLAHMTTLRIGGNARYVAYPENFLSLEGLMRVIAENGIPYKMIGKGSNLLCADRPFEGVVIRLDRHFTDCYFDGEYVTAEAGASIIALAYEAMKNGLSGLEFASGIPGTVGGVIFMNAGAYKSSVADIVDSVSVYRDGKIEWLSPEECAFAYRTSIFQQHPEWIVLAARFRLAHEDQNAIRSLMDSRRERRMASQPLDFPSAGSVFRNPMDTPAWKLIEGIGYRGRQIGGAKVSEKHVNFIVNVGGATAADFATLADEIIEKVRETYGVDLHMEVEKFNWQ
ncbi:MAG: UDP-N-acetylmuramate dehydrogenase [Solobacterium sp.]|nr:UDP-N-acetylmuramate dehydrogenase [Solobacterium sp.]